MRILIDARKLGHGGIGVSIENLVAGLLAEGSSTVSLIGNAARIKKYEWGEDVQVVEDEAAPYSLDELVGLPRRLSLTSYDLLHSPHFTLPFTRALATVMTVHDLIHVYHPQHWYYPLVAAPMLRSALRRATRIIAVSDATRRDIERFVHARGRILQKIAVVPNSLPSGFSAGQDSAREFVASRFRVRGRFLLALLSTVKPHKGLKDLLHAFATIASRGKGEAADIKLVLAGQGTEGLVGVEKLLAIAGETKGVHILGSVTKDELRALYSAADALVVPSKVEGFCLPALEAQSIGTPVIARPDPAVLELMTTADRVADDFSVAALERCLLKFLQEGTTRLTSAERAQHLSRFSRTEVTRRVLDVYESAVSAFGAPRKIYVDKRGTIAPQRAVGDIS